MGDERVDDLVREHMLLVAQNMNEERVRPGVVHASKPDECHRRVHQRHLHFDEHEPDDGRFLEVAS